MPLIDENKLILGAAISCNDKCMVHSLKISEIVGMGEDTYNKYLSYLTMSQEEVDKNIIKEGVSITPYEFIFLQCEMDDTFLIEFKKALNTFIREKVMISIRTREIFIGTENNYRVMDEEDFYFLQNILRKTNDLTEKEPIPKNESPIARKFRLRKEELERAKRKEALADGEKMTLAKSITALVCFNIGITLDNVGNLTYYQFHRLFDKAHAKYSFELDMQTLCAGGDSSKVKPKFWLNT